MSASARLVLTYKLLVQLEQKNRHERAPAHRHNNHKHLARDFKRNVKWKRTLLNAKQQHKLLIAILRARFFNLQSPIAAFVALQEEMSGGSLAAAAAARR